MLNTEKKMGLTEKEKEKLKALCRKLDITDFTINNEMSYWQNHLLIMKAAFDKLKVLRKKTQTYGLKILSFIKKEYGILAVPKIIKEVMDRYSQVVKTLQRVVEKVENEMAQIEKERNDIEIIPDSQIKLEMLRIHLRKLDMLDVYFDFCNHLLQEAQWLKRLLEEQGKHLGINL